MTKDEALKLALEALENVQYYGWGQTERDYDARTAAITALRKALALVNEVDQEQPAQQCNHCNGSGRMVRDPDIGTDQECFVCDGSGTIEPEQPAPVAEPRKQEREYRIGEKR